MTFFQCVLFNRSAFGFVMGVESMLRFPSYFWSFYLHKIAAAVVAAAVVLVLRRRWLAVVLSAAVSVLCESELIYLRFNGDILDAYSYTMIGNLNGYWSSILVLLKPSDLLFLLPVGIVTLACIILKSEEKEKEHSHWILSVFSLLLAFLLNVTGIILKEEENRYSIPDYDELNLFQRYNPFCIGNMGGNLHSRSTFPVDYSIVHAFANDMYALVSMPFEKCVRTLSEEDSRTVSMLTSDSFSRPVPRTGLVMILVESLESWAVNETVTPNICSFIEKHENILYVPRVRSQARHGVSGDGLMIANTGLLPVRQGAACMRFPENRYPSISELYDNAAIIIPGNAVTWNYGKMADAYHIGTCHVVENLDDRLTLSLLDSLRSSYGSLIALTMASHMPFDSYSQTLPIENPAPELSREKRDYLNCLHYTDACLAQFLAHVDDDPQLSSATIVITSDHKVFPDGDGCCPLIVYSPSILQKRIIHETAFQMDIYPTVMSLIGCYESCFWKGFGIDLRSDSSRIVSEEDAYRISDALISTDYFSSSAQ